MDYTLDKGNCRLTAAGCKKCSNQMLSVYDWLSDIPVDMETSRYVEVQFKNTRKGYYLNSNDIPLEKGDIVAVESNPGHDIGTVTLQGYLVALQMKKNGFDPKKTEVKRIYRKARQADIDKWMESKGKEHDAMLRSRKMAKDLHLDMKIGDVEYQGDGNKAIFYYIADERVDFRQLIKVLAEAFGVRIEMKQIGARQEAGRIGGTGPCGRELCCSTFLSSFQSVVTNAARVQDLSMNPQKLAGQCAKLKCCLNFELDNYIEAIKEFPDRNIVLETENATYHFFKLDAFARKMTYSTAPHAPVNLVEISLDRAKEVIEMNKRGEKPESLNNEKPNAAAPIGFATSVGEGSLTRFDKKKKRKNHHSHKNNGQRNDNNGQRKDNKPKKNNNE
ncbi:MAG: hypothetical protein J5808_02475 [Paludibacteraceae bacterium]|nr:hypothetical protein [Paludibacteraceae bacterium]